MYRYLPISFHLIKIFTRSFGFLFKALNSIELKLLVKNVKEYKQFIHKNDLFISIRYLKKGYSF